MNITTRTSTFAALGFLAMVGVSPVFAQETPEQPRRAQDPMQRQQDPQSMSQIAEAYRKLHDATMSALRAQSSLLANASKSGADAGASTSNATQALRGDQLLIAACTKGLLAGAPTGQDAMPSASGSSKDTDTRDANGEGANRQPGNPPTTDKTLPGASGIAGAGQTVGILLVSSNDAARAGGSSSGSTGSATERKTDDQPQDGSTGRSDRATADASASGARGALVPGAYTIKREGASVWLVDANDKVALRTTIESPISGSVTHDSGATRGGSSAGGGSGTGSGATGSGTTAMGGAHDWPLVFGAITKEAMTSMGWAKHEAGMTRR